MEYSKLSASEARRLFSYDPETGVIKRLVTASNNAKVGSAVGTPHNKGYLVVDVGGKPYLVHRLAWLIHTGDWPEHTIDHLNGVRSDNRFANLRDIPQRLNSQNRHGTWSKTGFAGVSPNGDRFRAKLKTDGRYLCLGTFDTPEEAHAVYVAAKRRLHAACTI